MLEDPLALSALVAGVAVVVLFVALLLRGVAPGNAQMPGWLFGLVIGVVAGAGTAAATGWLLGYKQLIPTPLTGTAAPMMSPAGGMMGGMPGMGGGGMPGMGGGMMGMGFGGGGGTRRLTMLVGKLNLLCDGVKIELSDEQRVSLAGLLTDLHVPAELAAADADACLKAIEAVLTEEQRAAIDSIELPRPRPAGGGPGGGPPGGMGMAMMGGGPGGMAPDNKNPFQEAANADRLDSLRSRLAIADSAAPAPATTANAEVASSTQADALPPPVEVDATEGSHGLPVREDLAEHAVAGE